MACNSNSFVWMAWNLLLELESDIHFQFLFGCANHGIGFFSSLDNIKLCIYINSCICKLKHIYIILHT
jgi:hypothetical protein